MSFGERLDNVSFAKLRSYVNSKGKNGIVEQVGTHSLLGKNQWLLQWEILSKSCDAAAKHTGKGDPEDIIYLEFQKKLLTIEGYWRN